MPAAPRSSARPTRNRVPDSDPDERRGTGPLRRHQHRHETGFGGHAVLEVDEHPVEAGPRADLDAAGRVDDQEGADHDLSAEDALPERGHVGGSDLAGAALAIVQRMRYDPAGVGR